jgi:hypothetical protein
MECYEPGAIRDEEIIAYLAGEKVRPAVKDHMERCASCTQRFGIYQRLEHVLMQKLYRWDCPSNQMLGEYQLGLCSAEDEALVKTHLSVCVLCSAEVEALSTFMAREDLFTNPVVVPAIVGNHRTSVEEEQRSVLERLLEPVQAGVRRLVATLVPMQPALYSVRGTASSWPRRYTAEDISISLQLERGSQESGGAQLVGFVTRKGASLPTLQGTPVVLLARDEKSSYTQHIDDLGNFIFTALVPATYTLELRFPETSVVIEEVAVALDEDG